MSDSELFNRMVLLAMDFKIGIITRRKLAFALDELNQDLCNEEYPR